MLPTLVDRQLTQGLKSHLESQFPLATPHFAGLWDAFFSADAPVVKGPYLQLSLPFRKVDASASRRFAPAIWAVRTFAATAQVIAVDIPIGLLDHATPGGRECDSLARKLLGPKRSSSVFPPPARSVLECITYADALNANRDSSDHALGISKQCFAILPKIREVDRFMTIELQQTLFEIHPELCFLGMNNGQAISLGKRTPDGLTARKELLIQNGFGAFLSQALSSRIPGAGKDDMLDACAACWTARRIALLTATCIPTTPPLDSHGLRMEMWY